MKLARRLFLTGEGRYLWSQAELGPDFSSFKPIDLTGFKREKLTALGSDVNFGQQFQGKIDKMALVGDSKWESHLTKLVQPYDAKDAKFFETDDDAWTWLTG